MSPVKGGIDLGGTKVLAVVVGPGSRVVGEAKRPTPREGRPSDVVAQVAATMQEAADAAGVSVESLSGVGVGSPGVIDAEAGTVSGAGNLPGWEGTHAMAPELSEMLGGVTVKLGNDVQVAVDGEYALGAGRDSSSLLGVWWGTGVGGGIILNGRPWVGRGAAGEIGHVVVKRGGARCTCGRNGCMEAYAGRGAMGIEARRLYKRGRDTELFEIMEKRGRERLQSGVWARALERNDPLAVKLIDRAVNALGAGVASVVNVLDVETVVVGGGLGSRLGAPYVERIRAAMLPHLFASERPADVVLAELGDRGGAVGASLLVGRRPARRRRTAAAG